MEVFLIRFQHIAKETFEQLDEKSLNNCREVSKSWKKSIDDMKLTWIQIVSLPRNQTDGETYLHLAAKTGQTKTFEMMLQNEQDTNPINKDGKTPFHLVCQYGHFDIAKMLIQKFIELKLEVNFKDNEFGRTAFHYVCSNGHSKIGK